MQNLPYCNQINSCIPSSPPFPQPGSVPTVSEGVVSSTACINQVRFEIFGWNLTFVRAGPGVLRGWAWHRREKLLFLGGLQVATPILILLKSNQMQAGSNASVQHGLLCGWGGALPKGSCKHKRIHSLRLWVTSLILILAIIIISSSSSIKLNPNETKQNRGV